MAKADLVLEILNEGEGWHDIEEVAARLNIPSLEVKEIINFLARHNFVIVDETGKKAKLGSLMHEFMAETCEVHAEDYV